MSKTIAFYLPDDVRKILETAENKSATVDLAIRSYRDTVESAVAVLRGESLLQGVVKRALTSRDVVAAVDFARNTTTRSDKTRIVEAARIVATDIREGGLLSQHRLVAGKRVK